MKQKLALSKFHKEAGDDWRNSRFIYAINSIQAQAYQVRQMIKELLDVNKSLVCVGAFVCNKGEVFVSDMQTDCFLEFFKTSVSILNSSSHFVAHPGFIFSCNSNKLVRYKIGTN
jgi:hypothetical protein